MLGKCIACCFVGLLLGLLIVELFFKNGQQGKPVANSTNTLIEVTGQPVLDLSNVGR